MLGLAGDARLGTLKFLVAVALTVFPASGRTPLVAATKALPVHGGRRTKPGLSALWLGRPRVRWAQGGIGIAVAQAW